MRILLLALIVGWFSIFPGHVSASEIPEIKSYVNDYAGILSAEEKRALEKKLRDHETASSNQVVVLTVKDLGGKDIKQFANEVFTKAKIGQKKKDNGVLFIVSLAEKKVRIEVGRGLEGILPDGRAGTIIRSGVANFKEAKYYAAIDECITQILHYTSQEFMNKQPTIQTGENTTEVVGISILILLLVTSLIGMVTHELLGGVAGLIGGPMIATTFIGHGMPITITAVILGFILGTFSVPILRFIVETGFFPSLGGLSDSFSGGGGDSGGGGADSSFSSD